MTPAVRSMSAVFARLTVLAAVGSSVGAAQSLSLTIAGYAPNSARIGIAVDGGSLAEPIRAQAIPAPGSPSVSTLVTVPAGGPYRVRVIDGLTSLGLTGFYAASSGKAATPSTVGAGQNVALTVNLSPLSGTLDSGTPRTVVTSSSFSLAVNVQDAGDALDLGEATLKSGSSTGNLANSQSGTASKPALGQWRFVASVTTPSTPGSLYYQIAKDFADFSTATTLFRFLWPLAGPDSITVIDGSSAPIPVTPSSLSFAYQVGGAPPASQNLSLSGGIAAISFTAQANASQGNWLSVAPESGRTPATLVVSIDPTGLAAGTYLGNIAISATAPVASVRNVPVTLTVTGGTVGASLVLGTASLAFTASPGTPIPAAQSVAITSSAGLLSYTATAASSGNWLTVTPQLGATPGAISASVNAVNLAPGEYSGSIVIAAAGAANTPQTIAVTLTVGTAAPKLQADQTRLEFTGSGTLSKVINVTSSGAAINFQVTASSPGNWLMATPQFSATPAQVTVSVNPQGLQAGAYSGTIQVAAASASNSPLVIPVSLLLSSGGGGPTLSAVVSAASYEGASVAPGEIVTLFGDGLGPTQLTTLQVGTDGKVTTELAGTRVLMNGIPAPILYTSRRQVSAVAPYGVEGTSGAFIRVEYNGQQSGLAVLLVSPSKPAVFTLDASGIGQAAVLNQDGSVNSPENPAARGSVLQIFATGAGQTTPAGVDGSIAGAPLPKPVLPVKVKIGGLDAVVEYAGAAPGLVAGVLQVNARIPAEVVSSTAVAIRLEVGDRVSQTGATVSVK